MIFEEYCSYILSREKNLTEFTIPGSNVRIDKNELITNLRQALHDNSDRDYDYDGLLINTMLCYVSKDYLGKIKKFDESMDSILNNIRTRVERISTVFKRSERSFPFSYERIFEISVYYLRLITNILTSEKDQKASYVTADISPEAVIYVLNRKLSLESLDEEWEKKGWKTFYRDIKPSYSIKVDNYLKFVMLSTYIRYCEIMGF